MDKQPVGVSRKRESTRDLLHTDGGLDVEIKVSPSPSVGRPRRTRGRQEGKKSDCCVLHRIMRNCWALEWAGKKLFKHLSPPVS